ncbi:MAG TPA: thiamine pyrophosphate-dependent enzyme, partial [Limnochordia bacterium]
VIAVTGDGDGYGIGGNHFIHAMRRNSDITHIVENNMVYGLTKGQYSPTSPRGFITTTSPEGAIEVGTNPLALALSSGATFVARGFSGDPKHLASLIMEGIRHKGYALIDVLQACVIYNRINTYAWYRERIYKLEETGYDPTDLDAAWERAHEWGDRIPIGIFYRRDGEPTYESQVKLLADRPLVEQGPRRLTREEYTAILAEYM